MALTPVPPRTHEMPTRRRPTRLALLERPAAEPVDTIKRWHRISRRVAVASVLLLLVPYTAYFWIDPPGLRAQLLGLVPGLAAIGLLLASGFGRADLYLRVGTLSRGGALALAAVFPLLAVILAAGRFQGWDGALAFEGLLSGMSPELYFRASLLPALLWLLSGRLTHALMLQALLDVLWHARMFTQAPPAFGVVIFLVLFLAKLGWGYAAHYDRTLAWVVLQHSAFLVAMSAFTWG